MAAYIDASL